MEKDRIVILIPSGVASPIKVLIPPVSPEFEEMDRREIAERIRLVSEKLDREMMERE